MRSTDLDTGPETPAAALRGLPDADLMGLAGQLPPDERERLAGLRAYLRDRVRPESIGYWNREEFAWDLVAGLGRLGLGGLQADGSSHLFKGLAYCETARADVSLSAVVGIHNELVVGMLDRLGSEEQRRRWLPGLLSLRTLGAFALTEPEHGSDIAGGVATTAERDGGDWVITGAKRWIGAGTIAEFALVWARDTADGQVKAFLVETDRPGFSASKIEHKLGLRIMQNADLVLDSVRIPAANLLPGATDFSRANELLRDSRAWVGWQGAGIQLGALDVAREYAASRLQFGRPIAGFQLVQEGLAEMAGNATAALAMMAQIARLQEEGGLAMHHAALVKATTTRLARETVARGRALLGGNGIAGEYGMAKLFGDAEVIYTYEGTYEINSLIVGRALTGESAFT